MAAAMLPCGGGKAVLAVPELPRGAARELLAVGPAVFAAGAGRRQHGSTGRGRLRTVAALVRVADQVAGGADDNVARPQPTPHSTRQSLCHGDCVPE
jgi:hypothetical protein